MRSLKAQLSIAIVCAVLGVMLAYQFQTVNNATNLSKGKAFEELNDQLKQTQKQKDDIEKKVIELEKKIDEYEKSAATTGSAATSLKNELERLRMISGLTKVEGQGISITITPPQSSTIENKQPTQVYAIYLSQVVNELNASGAEAIMINDQRIVNTTQIRDVGHNIAINGIKLSSYSPFEIKAIGNSAVLEGGINLPGGVKQELTEQYGINVRIQKSNKLSVAKYNSVIEYKYATTVKEGE